MVKTAEDKKDLNHIDFSTIPSLRCNLRCSFCMYNASPDNDTTLDYKETIPFIEQIEWDKIGSWGFYGGEPSIDISLYDRFMDLIPKTIPKFVITNGSWSSSNHGHLEFWDWMNRRVASGEKLRIVISGTPEHKKYQRASLIDGLAKWEGVTVKGDDDIHPMGRAYKENWECTKKCIWHEQPIRLGIFPTGHIIMQNCDGVYPVVGTINYPFSKVFENAVKVRTEGCNYEYYNVNDAMNIRFILEKEKQKLE